MSVGTDINGKLHHRGVGYSIKRAGDGKWRWEISPPSCVQGLRPQEGEVSGEERDAIQAACAAIEMQTGISAP